MMHLRLLLPLTQGSEPSETMHLRLPLPLTQGSEPSETMHLRLLLPLTQGSEPSETILASLPSIPLLQLWRDLSLHLVKELIGN
jgi:hypothetical protein